MEAEVGVFGGAAWGRVAGVVEVIVGWSACAVWLPGGSPKDEVVRRNDEGSGQQPQRLYEVRPGEPGTREARRSAFAQRTHWTARSRSETRAGVLLVVHGL